MTRPPESLFNRPRNHKQRAQLEAQREAERAEEIRRFHHEQRDRIRSQPRWRLPNPDRRAA